MTCMFVQLVVYLFVPVDAFNDTRLVAYNQFSERKRLEVKSISWKCKYFVIYGWTNI